MASAILASSLLARAAAAPSLSTRPVQAQRQPAAAVGVRRQRLTTRASAKQSESSSRSQGQQSKPENREAVALSLALGLSVASAQAANAVEATDVVETLEKVEAFAKGTAEFLVKAFDVTRSTVETVVEVSKPAIEAATPVVKEAAKSALEAATPVVVDATGKAVKFLEEQGVDLEPVVQATKVASETTSTIVSEATVYGDKAGKALQTLAPAVAFLQSQSPQLLAAEAGALVLLYVATPYILASIAYSFRGFGGELTSAQVLDSIIKGDWTLVDVRSEEEKELAGIPSLPRNQKKRLLTVPVEEVPAKLRGQLKSPRSLEGELTAIKIASLKKLSKGSRVVVLDQSGGIAKNVARSLASLGFRNTFVVKDGMTGGQGWINSQLAVDYYESRAEYLSPASIISGAMGGGTTKEEAAEKGGTTQIRGSGKRAFLALPSGKTEADE